MNSKSEVSSINRHILPILIALLAAVLFTGLLYIEFYRTVDSRLYDLMLRIKPGIEEDPNIILLEVDDPTISEIDVYPLPRDVFADGLILIKEFEPAWTMLDIEFVDGSEDVIDFDFLEYGIPEEIDRTFTDLNDFQRQLVELILSGAVTQAEALLYLEDLEAAGWDAADQLIQTIRGITFSRDEYLGRAIAYLGDVSATINMTEDIDNTIPPELRAYAEENLRVNDYVTLNNNPLEVSAEILPSIMPVISSAAWAGFPRMYIDPDGVRRRIDPLYEHNGNYYTHMGFGTWWVREGRPPMTISKGRLEVGDMVIPLDRDGKMLINWPKRLFDGTPLNRKAAAGFDATNPDHRLSFFYLYYHDRLMDDLSLFLREMEDWGISSDIYGNTTLPLSAFEMDLEGMKAAMLNAGDGSRAAEYGIYRDNYLVEVEGFLNGEAESEVLSELQFVLEDPVLSDDDYNFYGDLYNRIPQLFSESRNILAELQIYRSYLRERLEGATIVAGYTGTSTTDYGANPFERKYMNMGIYGAVYNSLVQGDFLREVPIWFTGVVALIFGIVVSLLSNFSRKRSIANTLVGAVFIVAALAGVGAVFVFTGTYINILPLLLTLISAYLGTVIGNFLTTSKEKAVIQGAFDQVISPDVVKKIQDNPEMLNLGGEKRNITAMFTDIEKFSTITEKLGSSDKLFELLKRYLTPMSDIILDEQGTIDKYEGDAIIAFWNAPLDQVDHPYRACRAAMRMAKKEKQINDELIAEGVLTTEILDLLPHGRLFTRIGINTGENNIGFIGTDRRKDYTALGDEMNLAARLEGVNKTYDTQVLISGTTEAIIHTSFITRQLDMVRVMGKDKPVTIFELSCFKEDFTETERECFNYYREGLKHFRAKEWDESEAMFKRILAKIPDDGPTQKFVDRCRNYRKNPPPANWDGVYKMETK